MQHALPGIDALIDSPSVNGVRHVEIARVALELAPDVAEKRIQAFSGRHYTAAAIARHMLDVLASRLIPPAGRPLTVCDPFAGDGRLAFWFAGAVRRQYPSLPIKLELWDIDEDGLAEARREAARLEPDLPSVETATRHVDSFSYAVIAGPEIGFDVVITNPPWENLKPDIRYTKEMAAESREQYIQALRSADAYLAHNYPESQPRRKFAGWGTNLARPGLQLSLRIGREHGGLVAAVLPASVLADSASGHLREWMFRSAELFDIAYYPAEARAFGTADVASITVALEKKTPEVGFSGRVTSYNAAMQPTSTIRAELTQSELMADDFIVPFSQGQVGFTLRRLLTDLPRFGELEGKGPSSLWAGREIDETRIEQYLRPADDGNFVRGRMIDRFEIRTMPRSWVQKPGWVSPPSVAADRIVWRDISRPSQKRRMVVTLIPKGFIAGNTLGVAYFLDQDTQRLRWLLGVMSSLVFEIQLRALLNTGHITLNSMRNVRVPVYEEGSELAEALISAVDARMTGMACDAKIEALVGHMYGLDMPMFEQVLAAFPKVTHDERGAILKEFSAV